MKSKIPEDSAEMLRVFGQLSDDELQEMFAQHSELETRLQETGPKNDAELHEWIRYELNIDIPRVAVCEGHVAPFTFLADLYFDRVDAALAVANRGGAKTFMVAVLHWLNARFKPGIESCTFGAIEAQSFRAYAHLKGWVFDEDGNKKDEIVGSLMRETVFRNGSKIEVLGSTPEAVNGPHPQIAHADEIELMRDDTWLESRNMRQPLDSLVATPKGWTTIGDLNVGDEIFGLDGQAKKVLNLHEISEKDIYKIELTDGRVAECCDEHLWMICDQRKRSRNAPFKILQTKEIIKQGLKTHGGYRFGLPIISPVEYKQAKLPLDPYLLGVLLGDGCLTRKDISFRSNDLDIVNRVSSSTPRGVAVRANTKTDGTIVYYLARPGSHGKSRNPVIKQLENLGLIGKNSHDKFIPDLYKFSSVAQRINLIRGLMDTDGSFTKDAYFFTVSEQLANDVSEIVYSLGGRGLLRKKKTSASARKWGSCGYIYEVSVSLPSWNPFFCKRKAEKFTQRKRTLGAAIKSITPIGRKPARCITVEDSMYLTNKYIPTHNTISKKIRDGRVCKPQDVATSTRKGPSGRVQQLIDEIERAISEGYKPPRQLYIWCIKETAAPVINCQVARPDLPDTFKCPCHTVRKGEWEDGSPRLLRDVCNGDFYRSRGWQPYAEVVKQFSENDQVTFEVQQLCSKPEMTFHYVPTWRDERHCIRDFEPDPQNGPIFQAVDWGGTNPHAVNWYQLLHHEVEVGEWVQPGPEKVVRRLKEGTLVCFDEIYIAEIGNEKLGQMVREREQYWANKYKNWRVAERFADPQGKAARMDWKAMGLKTVWRATREFDEHVKAIRAMFEDDLFAVAGERCPMFVREIKAWRADPKTNKQIDKFNHAMSEFRYVVANTKRLRQKWLRGEESSRPKSLTIPRRSPPTRKAEGPVALKGRDDKFDNWRRSLGEPVTRVRH